jgi:branched-chain amino acid transport system ATP-binding protein
MRMGGELGESSDRVGDAAASPAPSASSPVPSEAAPATEPVATSGLATADGPDPTSRLRARGLGVTFGGVRAVHDLDLDVGDGQLVGLIGPNGAGKTTTIDALTGFVRHQGRVWAGAVDLTDAPPHRRAAAGVARTWQSLELFDDLTVAENLQVASDRSSLVSTLADVARPRRHQVDDGVAWAIDVLGLGPVAGAYPTQLPLGQRKLAAVARGLAARPSVLLLDEPAAGLDSSESLALGAILQRVVEHGTSILLVDHDMALVLGVCDHLYVLDFGRLITAGDPDAVRADPAVIHAYLGGHA